MMKQMHYMIDLLNSIKQYNKQFKTKRSITEKLKEKDQMNWVQEMNNIQNCVEEIINREIIYM